MRAKVTHGPSSPLLVAVEHLDIGDPLAQQPEGRAKAASAGADDRDVEERLSIVHTRGDPGRCRIAGVGKVAAHDDFELRQRPGDDRPIRCRT
jgi:hypothetical protein